MKAISIRILNLLVCLVTFAVSAKGTYSKPQGDTSKVYTLPEVIVTATRMEANAKDVARSVSVISSAELKGALGFSVGDLLTQQEGIYVVGAGQNPGVLQSIFMRGAGNNQTAVMIDDVRLTDPSTVNDAIDGSELSLAGIDRIEIVRGSHSTLYGSSAIGGVINIITQKNRLPGLHVDAMVSGGSFGEGTSAFSQNVSLNYSLTNGLYANFDLSNMRVHGLNATIDTITNPKTYNNPDKDGFTKVDFGGKLGFKNEVWDVYASFRRTHDEADVDKGAYVDDDNAASLFKRNLLTYGATRSLSGTFSLKLVGGYSTMDRTAVDDSSLVDRIGTYDHTYSKEEWEGGTISNELQAIYDRQTLKFLVGVGQYRETMTARNYYYSNGVYGLYTSWSNLDSLKLKTNTWSAFVHADISGVLIDPQLSALSLGVGGRLIRHQTFGTYSTFELNPSYRLGENALLFASYSTGFNAPSLYQLFTPDQNYISGITRGNPSLQPEQSGSLEAGVRFDLFDEAEVTVSYFRTELKHAIDYVYLWDKNVPVSQLGSDWMRDDYRGDTYLNLGTQTMRGFEFSIRSSATRRLWYSLNVSLLSGELDYSPSDINNAQTQGNHVQLYDNGAFLTGDVKTTGLVRRPSTMNGSIGYRILEPWSVRIDVRRVGARDDIYYNMNLGPYGALSTVSVNAYTLTDLTSQGQVSDALLVSIKLENCFNVKYSEINGYTTRGRGIYAALRYAFDGK